MAELVKLYTGLKQVIWVVARTSRHMDWHEIPEGEGGKTGVAVWHEIIDETSGSTELPTHIPKDAPPPPVVMVSQIPAKGHKVVEISQGVSYLIWFSCNLLTVI